MRVFFLRDEKKFPVACVAAEFHAKTNSISWGVSVFNPKDDFNRETGRKVAIGRLKAALHGKPDTMYRRRDPLNAWAPKRFIMAELAGGGINPADNLPWYPDRVRRAAALWLINHPPVTEVEPI